VEEEEETAERGGVRSLDGRGPDVNDGRSREGAREVCTGTAVRMAHMV